MNYPVFKLNLIVGLLLWLVVTTVIAQNNLMLSLDIKVTNDPIGPIDPLVFQLVLTNTGTEDYTGLAPWGVHTTTWVYFRSSESQQWESLEIPFLRRYITTEFSSRGMGTFSLAAGESHSLKLVMYNDIPSYFKHNPNPQYYFGKIGQQYELRAEYYPKEGQAIKSPVKSFRVDAYQGEDAKAFEWLKIRKIPHFMYKYGFNEKKTYFVNEDAQVLISQFPNSRFTPWAKRYLAYAYEFGLWIDQNTHNPPDLVRAAALAQEILDLDQISPEGQKVVLLSRLHSQMQDFLTEIERHQGKPKTAQLSLEIQVLSNPIEPLEPLKYQLVLTNTGSKNYTDLARLDRINWATTKVEYRLPNSSKWEILGGERISISVEQPKGNWKIAAGESHIVKLSVHYGTHWFLLGGNITYCCAKAGEYRLRATYNPYKEQTIQSNEIGFRVNSLQGVDAVAFKWLKERQDSRYSRSEPNSIVRLLFRMDRRDAPELISRFPNSRFVPWAKLLLIHHYKYGWKIDDLNREPPNLEKAKAQALELIESTDYTEGKTTVLIPPEVREAAQKLLKKLKHQSQ